jgi:hypothetical protein
MTPLKISRRTANDDKLRNPNIEIRNITGVNPNYEIQSAFVLNFPFSGI